MGGNVRNSENSSSEDDSSDSDEDLSDSSNEIHIKSEVPEESSDSGSESDNEKTAGVSSLGSKNVSVMNSNNTLPNHKESEDSSEESSEESEDDTEEIQHKSEIPSESSNSDSESDTEKPAKVSSLGPKNSSVMNSANAKKTVSNNEESEDSSEESSEESEDDTEKIQHKSEIPNESSDSDSESDTEKSARVSSLGPKNVSVMNSKHPLPNREESEDSSEESSEESEDGTEEIQHKSKVPDESSDSDSESDTEKPAKVSSLGSKNSSVMNSANAKKTISNHEESEDSREESSDESEDSSEEMKQKSRRTGESSESDSETDIEKPSRAGNPSPKTISITDSTNAVKPIPNHDESTDSSEESNEELSMSLLQKSGKPKSVEQSSYGVLSTPRATSQHVSGVTTSAQRKENRPVMSASDSESESERPEVKEESSSPSSVPDEPADVILENELSPENTQLTPTRSNVVALQNDYTRIPSSVFDISEGSCVWLLQVPRDVSASDLIGQKLPTQLYGGEKIDLPSYPLLIREQASEQSKRSLICMMSTGDCNYKLQSVHPNGFWTLRRPPVFMSEQVTKHTWGVPIAPVPIEELLKTKTNRKQFPSAIIQETPSRSKKHRPTGLHWTEETSLNPEKKKKKGEKSKHTEILPDDSNQMGNTTKSRKRSLSTCEGEDTSPPMKKKNKVENSFIQNNHQNSLHSDKIPSSLSKKSNLGKMRKEKKKKKTRDISNDSFDSSIKIKQEVVENENVTVNQELVNNANNVPRKKKKNKDKSHVSESNVCNRSNSLQLLENQPIKSERRLNDSVRDSGQEEEGVFKKRKRKETESSFEMEHQTKSSLSMRSDNDGSVLKTKKKKK